MLLKIVTRLITATLMLFSIVGYAQVIELDNINPDHCRQQLLEAKDKFEQEYQAAIPVILFYMKGCPYSDKVRPYYEKVAADTPDRVFFAFNFANHNDPRSFYRAAQACFGFVPFGSPTFTLYLLDKEPENKSITGMFRMGLDGSATEKDIKDFIEVKTDYWKSKTLTDKKII